MSDVMTILSHEQIAYIKNGGVVAYPTSTLPGLGCIPTQQGLDTLFSLKSRSPDKPVSLGIASLEQVSDLVFIDARVVEFVEAFPRGGLSVIYPAKQHLTPALVENRLQSVSLSTLLLGRFQKRLVRLPQPVRMRLVKNQPTR